jgi:hypothetical protein
MNALAIVPASSMLRASMTPACLAADENTLLDTARAPVCELAAFIPELLRPPLSTMTGFLRVASLAFVKKSRPSFMPSI